MSFYLIYLIAIKLLFPSEALGRPRTGTPSPAKRWISVFKTLRFKLMLCNRTALMTDQLSVCVSACMHACVWLTLGKEVTVQGGYSQVIFATDNFKAVIARGMEWRSLVNIYRLRFIFYLFLLYKCPVDIKYYRCNLMWFWGDGWGGKHIVQLVPLWDWGKVLILTRGDCEH